MAQKAILITILVSILTYGDTAPNKGKKMILVDTMRSDKRYFLESAGQKKPEKLHNFCGGDYLLMLSKNTIITPFQLVRKSSAIFKRKCKKTSNNELLCQKEFVKYYRGFLLFWCQNF